MADITRTVLFFRAVFNDENGVPWPDQGWVWKYISELPFATRVRDRGDEKAEAMFLTLRPDGSVEGRLVKDRKSDLPTIGEQENDHPLGLTKNQTLRESMHFVWWDVSTLPPFRDTAPPPGECLLALELNVRAPRDGALARYVEEVLNRKVRLKLNPIYTDEAWEALKRTHAVKAVTARIPVHRLEVVQGNEMNGLDLAADLRGLGTLEWTLRTRMGDRGMMRILDTGITRLRRLVEQEGVEVWVTLEGDREIPLEQSKMTQELIVRPAAEGAGSVSSNSMHQEIRNVVIRRRQELGRLLGREWK